MNKIEFDRLGVDGISRTRDDVERHFCKCFEDKIRKKLTKIVATGYENVLVEMIKKRLHLILLATPTMICGWLDIVDRYRHLLTSTVQYPKIIGKVRKIVDMPLKEALLNAFDYEYFRKLVGMQELANMLNVKTCPYCNMSYTLYTERNTGQKKEAKFEFDHFFDKKTYPMFSMSLYNLIPSCSICNKSKKQQRLSLAYHPYHSSIHRSFFFEVDDALELLYGKSKKDLFNISLIPVDRPTDFAEFEKAFHLQALYSRHRDVAKEVFDKAYLYVYYSSRRNFKFIPKYDYKYLRRLWLGTYTDERDIEKRPMTKFILDLEQQAFALQFSEEN